MLNHIDKYILRQTLAPMGITLCIAAMLLTLEKMLSLFDFVVNEGGPVDVVWQMLGNLIPQYLGLAVPIGLFLGVLFGFRKLAISSELDALITSGISHHRLLRAPMMLALFTFCANMLVIGFVQPIARYKYEGLQFDLRSGALGASIKMGEFVHIGDDITLRIEESRDDGRKLMRIFLSRVTNDGATDIVTAESGTFFATDDRDRIVFRLYNGKVVTMSNHFATPRTLTFEVHDLPISLPQSKAFRGRGERHLELTLPELYQVARDGDKPQEERLAAEANLNFRLVNLSTLLVLPFLGIALGVPPKRTQSAIGVFFGISLMVVFHEFIEFCEKSAAHGAINPELALWLPYLVFCAITLQFYRVLSVKVGGQPLRGLELLARRITVLVRAARRLLFGKKRPA